MRNFYLYKGVYEDAMHDKLKDIDCYKALNEELMKHITIVIPDGQTTRSTVTCIVSAYDIFIRANQYWKEKFDQEMFTIELAGVTKTAKFDDGLLVLKPQTNISNITKTNLIIIPSLVNDYQEAMKGNKLLIKWIADQHKAGAEIASMCTGAFLLASSGLLDGKNCSTNWQAADNFRATFPKVNLQADRVITDENGIYTNGGAYSFLNLMIYLVEKFYDRQTAIFCSKVFQIEIDRQSQSPFIIFTGQKRHGDEMVQKAQAHIENNIHEKLSVENLSSRFSMARRNFDRRFIHATGNTPVEYLQRVRIEAAKKSFETSRKTINEVMYEVGYLDTRAFREVFRKITGISPIEYKRKYNKEAVI